MTRTNKNALEKKDESRAARVGVGNAAAKLTREKEKKEMPSDKKPARPDGPCPIKGGARHSMVHQNAVEGGQAREQEKLRRSTTCQPRPVPPKA